MARNLQIPPLSSIPLKAPTNQSNRILQNYLPPLNCGCKPLSISPLLLQLFVHQAMSPIVQTIPGCYGRLPNAAAKFANPCSAVLVGFTKSLRPCGKWLQGWYTGFLKLVVGHPVYFFPVLCTLTPSGGHWTQDISKNHFQENPWYPMKN